MSLPDADGLVEAGHAFVAALLEGDPPRLASTFADVPFMTVCRDITGEEACVAAVEDRLASSDDRAVHEVLCGKVAQGNLASSSIVGRACDAVQAPADDLRVAFKEQAPPALFRQPHHASVQPLHTVPAVYAPPEATWQSSAPAFFVAFALLALLLFIWVVLPLRADAPRGTAADGRRDGSVALQRKAAPA